jgi:hypothetical protein
MVITVILNPSFNPMQDKGSISYIAGVVCFGLALFMDFIKTLV